MKAYGAIIGASKVITVYAEDVESARKEATRRLENHGRYGIIKQWLADWLAGGQVMRDEDTCDTFRLRHSGHGPGGNIYTLKGE